MADLSIIASLLKDTNKKLDKLHSDNDQSDSKGDIIKGALPEIINDIYQSNRQIAQWEKEDARDKATDTLIKKEDEKDAKREETTQKILGDIKEPLKTLGLAIPKSGFNAFSEKASDISAEKALPSDFKLILQALTPKALMGGFKVGLGDMFKELGGGIKKIGSGMKSLGSKGLTAAQRKSEEKEKENKEKKKDGFFKKQFGSTIKLLGGILKTVKLAGKAGFIALAGAAALFALAKLIESPYWLKVAGIVEYGLNQIMNLFKFMDEQFGVGGVIATALALYFGPKAITTLAGIGIKALAKKLFFKGATNTLAGSAGKATGALAGKGGLLSALGRIALPIAAITAAAYGLYKLRELIHNRGNKTDNRIVDETIESVKKPTATQEQIEKAQRKLSEIRNRVGDKGKDAGGLNEKTLNKIDAANEKLAKQLQKMQENKPSPVQGKKPSDLMKLTRKDFQKALLSRLQSTIFKGNIDERIKQFAGVGDSVFSAFFGTEEFKKLNLAQQKELLQIFANTEQKELYGRRRSRQLAGVRLGTQDQGILGRSLQQGEAYAEMNNKRRKQLEDPTIIKLNDELRKNTEELKKMNDAKNGGKGDTTVTNSNVVGATHHSTTVAAQTPLNIRPDYGVGGIGF